MATKVYMEALSPTMEEGRLISWLKNEGDQVNEGDLLAEVETDKATMELVARGSGIMRKQLIAGGDTSNVGTLIAVIAADSEDISALIGGGGSTAPAVDKSQSQSAAPQALAASGQSEPSKTQQIDRGDSGASAVPAGGSAPAAAQASPSAGSSDGGRQKVSPVARRLATEGGLELAGVTGSGPGGRIIKRDIEAALQGGGAQAASAQQTPEAEEAPTFAPAAAGAEYRDIPLTQMRKTIAKRLTQSIGPIPTFYLTVEIDMTEAMELRKKVNTRFEKQGVKVSPNDLTIKAVAAALRKHPWVNSAWTGETIRQYDAVHIGVAVAVDEGLITPIIRNADKKGLSEISQEVKELAGRAREKKLKPEEYTGATFSISNLGMFGVSEFTAVINPPEACILAVGAAEDKVVVVDGEMVIRNRMKVTLSCDHRVVDGAIGAQFLQTLKQNLEDPMMMLA